MPVLAESAPAARQSRRWWIVPPLVGLFLLVGLLTWSYYRPLVLSVGDHHLALGHGLWVSPGDTFLAISPRGLDYGAVPLTSSLIRTYNQDHYVLYWR